MAIIPCAACGRNVFDRAPTCTGAGRVLTPDLGGAAGTRDVTDAVPAALGGCGESEAPL